MQIPVVVEKIKKMAYQARSSEPLAASAEGPTPEAAMRKLHETELEGLGPEEIADLVRRWQRELRG